MGYSKIIKDIRFDKLTKDEIHMLPVIDEAKNEILREVERKISIYEASNPVQSKEWMDSWSKMWDKEWDKAT